MVVMVFQRGEGGGKKRQWENWKTEEIITIRMFLSLNLLAAIDLCWLCFLLFIAAFCFSPTVCSPFSLCLVSFFYRVPIFSSSFSLSPHFFLSGCISPRLHSSLHFSVPSTFAAFLFYRHSLPFRSWCVWLSSARCMLARPADRGGVAE